METHEWVAVVASLIGLLSLAIVLTVAIVRLSRSPNDGVARFTYGYLGVFGILVGLASGLDLALVLGPYISSSWLAAAAVGAVNLLVQPVSLLLCWTGVRKIALGVCWHIGYAWVRIPENRLTGSSSERRALSLYCVLQGVIALALGAILGVGCAWPLVQWGLG